MAVDAVISRALFSLINFFMKVVVRGIIGVCPVAAQAETVALNFKLLTMDIVAVTAFHIP